MATPALFNGTVQVLKSELRKGLGEKGHRRHWDSCFGREKLLAPRPHLLHTPRRGHWTSSFYTDTDNILVLWAPSARRAIEATAAQDGSQGAHTISKDDLASSNLSIVVPPISNRSQYRIARWGSVTSVTRSSSSLLSSAIPGVKFWGNFTSSKNHPL